MATPIRTPNDNAEQAKQERAASPRSISSRDLMGAARVLIIRHGKEDYRLQLTTAGKLILTK